MIRNVFFCQTERGKCLAQLSQCRKIWQIVLNYWRSSGVFFVLFDKITICLYFPKYHLLENKCSKRRKNSSKSVNQKIKEKLFAKIIIHKISKRNYIKIYLILFPVIHQPKYKDESTDARMPQRKYTQSGPI